MKNGRRILITGGTGFIGRACAAELKNRGFAVTTLGRGRATRKTARKDGGTIEHITADLFDRAKIKQALDQLKPTDLLNCAWDVTPGVYWDSPVNFDWVEPTADLLRAFAAAGGKRAVGIGSCAEYGWGGQVLSEISTPCTPASAYGQAKLKTFNELAKISTDTGVNFAWARMFYLFGPGEARGRLVADAVNALLANQSFVCRNPDAERDLIFVEDAARALADLVRSDLSGALNIATGRAVSVRSVAGSIGALLGREELIKFEPAEPGENDRFCAGISRLVSELHFSPAFSLRQGLERTIDWWKSRKPPSA